MREPESCAGQRLRAIDGQRPESRAAGVGAPIGSRRLHGDDGLARIGSQSLFFFSTARTSWLRGSVRATPRRPSKCLVGWWALDACGARTDRSARGRRHTHTPPRSHLTTLSLPPLPLLPLRPGPGAAAWNGSLGPALQFYHSVLPYTYAAPVQMTAVTAHKASHAASSHRTV